MEYKKLGIGGLITLLTLATLFNFIPEPEDTHVCLLEGMEPDGRPCARLSGTGLTCYPNNDNRRGSKYCVTGWLPIDRSDIVTDTVTIGRETWSCPVLEPCVRIN